MPGLNFPQDLPKPSVRTRVLSQFVVGGVLSCGVLAVVLWLAQGAVPDAGVQPRGFAQELAQIDVAALDPEAWYPIVGSDPLCRQDCAQPHKAYRFDFDRPVPTGEVAIYVPLYGAAEFWLNGQIVGRTGRMQPPISDGGYRPYYVDLPSQPMFEKGNQLLVLVAGFDKGGHSLGPVYIGPAAEMRRAHSFAWLLLVDAMAVSVGIMLFLLLLASMLYLQTGRSTIYLCFMALLAFACLRAGLRLSPDWPAGHGVRMPIYFLGTFGVLLSSTLLVRRLAERQFDHLEALMMAITGIAVIAIAAALSVARLDAWLVGVAVTQVTAVVAAGYQIWLLAGVLPRTPRRFGPFVVCLFFLSIALVLQEVISHRLFGPLIIPTSHLAILPLILALTIVIAERYQATHVGLLSERQKLVRERERLRSDIHDGVGGELAGLLLQAKRGQIDPSSYATALENSIRDLRVMIDSLDPRLGTDLASALGVLRSRLQPWVEGCGFDFRWRNELPPGIQLGEEKLLTLYRLIQELAANAVRHSGGDEIVAEFSLDQSHLLLRFGDNGGGIPDAFEPGVGMQTIHSRAKSLGASIEQTSSADGLIWTLTMSIDSTTRN